MKSYRNIYAFVVLLIFISGTCIAAGSTLKQFDGIEGRSYHADFYEDKSCDSCHDSEKPLTLPKDDACLQCHDQAELIKSTSRSKKEEWQNPHNNMHYGKDVPCMECHGEHQSRKNLCEGCHSFKYKKFKR